METQTITEIRAWVSKVDKALVSFRPKDHKGKFFGPESEYTPETLKAGLNALLVDLRGLTNAHRKFVQISTRSERSDILQYLKNIQSSLVNAEYPSVASYVDSLKVTIRAYHARGSSESQEELIARANQLNETISGLESDISQVRSITNEAVQASENIQAAKENYKSFANTINELGEKVSQTETLKEQSEANHQKIQELRALAISHEQEFSEFSNQIEARKNQLAEQQQSTENYEEKLREYTEHQDEARDEAEKLLQSARAALNDMTAAGISTAFTARYKADKSWLSEALNLFWVVGAAVLIGAAGYVGYTVLTSGEEISLGSSITRFTLMSIAFSAAVFCANRYVRYKNITEDYGYKSVLAKSMVAFLDQFEDPKERELYLKSVLKQILQDPLRKQHDTEHPALGLWDRVKRTEKNPEDSQ